MEEKKKKYILKYFLEWDYLPEMSICFLHVLEKNKKKHEKCYLLNFLPSILSIGKQTTLTTNCHQGSSLFSLIWPCQTQRKKISLYQYKYLIQRMKKPSIRLVRPAKTKTSLHICAFWSVFADNICLLQPLGYPKRDKWKTLPFWVDVFWAVFDGHIGLNVGFVMCWFICFFNVPNLHNKNSKTEEMNKLSRPSFKEKYHYLYILN